MRFPEGSVPIKPRGNTSTGHGEHVKSRLLVLESLLPGGARAACPSDQQEEGAMEASAGGEHQARLDGPGQIRS